jgi:hypothetical protein
MSFRVDPRVRTWPLPPRTDWQAGPVIQGASSVLASGHAQVGDGDEVLAGPESPGCPLGLLLKQPVHRLHEGVAAVNHHATDNRREALTQRGGGPPEGLKPAAPRPARPGPEVRARQLGTVVRSRSRLHLAQRHLQALRLRS